MVVRCLMVLWAGACSPGDTDGDMFIPPLDYSPTPCAQFVLQSAKFWVAASTDEQVLHLEITNPDGDECGGTARLTEFRLLGRDPGAFHASRAEAAMLGPDETTTMAVRYKPGSYAMHQARLEVDAPAWDPIGIDLVGQVGDAWGSDVRVEEPSIPLPDYACTFAQGRDYRLHLVQLNMKTGQMTVLPNPISKGSIGPIVGPGQVGGTWYYAFLVPDGKVYAVNPMNGDLREHTIAPRSTWTITDQDGSRLALFQRSDGPLTDVRIFDAWTSLIADEPVTGGPLSPSGPHAAVAGDDIVTAGDRATGLYRYRLGNPQGERLTLTEWDRKTAGLDILDGHLMLLGGEDRASEQSGRVPIFRIDPASGRVVHRVWVPVGSAPGYNAPSGLSCKRL